jgi:hypothetical protein
MTVDQPLNVNVTLWGASTSGVSGTITLTSGSYASAPAAIVNCGSACANFVIPANSLAVGNDVLTASYSGDANDNPSTGTASVTVVVAGGSFIVGNGTLTVTRGATTGNTVPISVTPAAFTGSVTMTAVVASSPPGAQNLPTFSFGSTSPVSISSATAGTATLIVTTTAPTIAGLGHPRRPSTRWYAAGGAALACVLLFGIPARRRSWPLGVLLVLAAISGMTLGCGGGGGSNGGGGGNSIPGTTPGTYTVTVTGASGSKMSQGTVTITVQ